MTGTPCKVKLTQRQTVEGESDETVFSYQGSFAKKGDMTFVTYKEEIEGAKVCSLLKFDEKSCQVVRTGDISSKMDFLVGAISKFKMDSPMGVMSFDIKTTSLLAGEKNICISYMLMQAETVVSENTLTVEIEEAV